MKCATRKKFFSEFSMDGLPQVLSQIDFQRKNEEKAQYFENAVAFFNQRAFAHAQQCDLDG
jgi:hypothetical protein